MTLLCIRDRHILSLTNLFRLGSSQGGFYGVTADLMLILYGIRIFSNWRLDTHRRRTTQTRHTKETEMTSQSLMKYYCFTKQKINKRLVPCKKKEFCWLKTDSLFVVDRNYITYRGPSSVLSVVQCSELNLIQSNRSALHDVQLRE